MFKKAIFCSEFNDWKVDLLATGVIKAIRHSDSFYSFNLFEMF